VQECVAWWERVVLDHVASQGTRQAHSTWSRRVHDSDAPVPTALSLILLLLPPLKSQPALRGAQTRILWQGSVCTRNAHRHVP